MLEAHAPFLRLYAGAEIASQARNDKMFLKWKCLHGLYAGLIMTLACMVGTLAANAEEPALPPGLGAPAAEEPALPAGLGGTDEPALPAGLANETTPPSETTTSQPGPLEKLHLNGFWEARAGTRFSDDPAQENTRSIAETRLQLETEFSGDWGAFEVTADTYLDGIIDDPVFDLRQARLTLTPLDNVDLRIGRQVLTWGTGDMLFINDLFPKDWQSFFIGRDVEYLKAPSDSIRIGFFNDIANIDFAYTPKFTPDRYITGDYVSYYDPLFRRFNGASRDVDANPPSDWFEDDEFAVRLYREVGRFQVALYGYWGYWKSPGGQKLRGVPLTQATFPRLHVYGASIRGPVGKGIFNAEVGYYDSVDDSSGDNFFVNNSEFRALVGYEQEIATNLTGALQVYWERMLDYGAYRDSLFLIPARDEDRLVFTLRLTKLLMNQNLVLSWFSYYSPTDGDAYLRPSASYKVTDAWTVELGGNLWFGEKDYTFFGQFENNNNIYLSARYAF